MSGRSIEDFLDDAEAFDALSDEDKARLMAGETLEGETKVATDDDQDGTEENSASPDAATVAAEEVIADPEEPVVLARDGKHTIPFSELEAARERARQLEQEVIALKGAAAPGQPEGEQQAAIEAPNFDAELRDLRRQYREALYSGDNDLSDELEAKIDAKLGERTDRIVSERLAGDKAQSEAEARAAAEIADVEARAAALIQKYQFLDPASPAVNQDAIDLVVSKRDALMRAGVPFADAVEQAVAKVAPLFESTATPKQGAGVAQKAAEAIAKAKAQVPTSLSQVPAGARAHHDEGEAIREMDINQLSRSLESKTPDEIMKLMNRVL